MRIQLLLATVTAAQVAAQPSRTTPDFGPNVTIFDPATPAATIQSRLDSIFASQESSEFGAARYALLFKPGTYDVDARIGFYTQVSGLGLSPTDVVINGGMRADLRSADRGGRVLDDGGWSSGGFLADSKVDGQVRSGSQQQWLTRNSALGSWKGSNWNMVFVGTERAPTNSFPDPPYTTDR